MKKLHTHLCSWGLILGLALSTAQAQDCFYTTVSQASAPTVQNVCVDFQVHNFVDLSSIQFSVSWDETVLAYNNVVDVDLPGNGVFQFGTSLINDGILTFFWVDPERGWDLPDRYQVFSVCFTIIGANGTNSSVAITSEATNVEAYDSNLDLVDFNTLPGGVTVGTTPPPASLRLQSCESNPNCLNDFVTVVEGGVDPLTFTWAGPSGFNSNDSDLKGVIGGLYSLTITDNSNLTIDTTFLIGTLNPSIDAVEVTDIKCSGFNNGAVNITVSGGVPPYEYQWSNGSVFEDISSLPPADYSVTVTDQNGCFATGTYTVSSNDPIELVSIDIDCVTEDGNDGFVTVEVTGGSGNYSFDWSFGPSTSTGVVGNLSPGDYFVSVTDEFNCPYAVIPFGISNGIIGTQNDTICEGSSTTLNIDAPQGESFVWTPATDLDCTDCPAPVATPETDITYYVAVTDSTGCTDRDSVSVSIRTGCMWPGDTDLSKDVNHFDLLNIGLGAGRTGLERPGASIEWVAQVALDWAATTPQSNVNFKNLDTDGDGTIGLADTNAIARNWGEMHNLTGSGSSTGLLGGPPFSIAAADTLLGNQSVSLPITFGDPSNVITGLYGLAFSISYDPNLVEAGSVRAELRDSWMGVASENLVMMQRNFPAEGRIDIAITAMDGNNRSGLGGIALLHLDLKPVTEPQTLVLTPSDPRIITNEEVGVAVSLQSKTITIVDRISGLVSPALAQQVRLFPNPSSGTVYLDAAGLEVEAIQLYDWTGRLLATPAVPQRGRALALPEQLSGTYLVRIQTTAGLISKRLVLLR